MSGLGCVESETEAGPPTQQMEQAATWWRHFRDTGKDHWPQLFKKSAQLASAFSFSKVTKPFFSVQQNQNKPLGPMETRRETGSFPTFIIFYFIFFFKLIIYLFILFLAVLGLRFCARAFSSCGERGPLFIAVRGPLTITASLVAEHRLQMRRLSSCGSRAQ